MYTCTCSVHVHKIFSVKSLNYMQDMLMEKSICQALYKTMPERYDKPVEGCPFISYWYFIFPEKMKITKVLDGVTIYYFTMPENLVDLNTY